MPSRQTLSPARHYPPLSPQQIAAGLGGYPSRRMLGPPPEAFAAASGEIPLDPGHGGQSIGTSALETADIIVSTTDEFISEAIRGVSSAQVSHAMLYIGGGQVVEAVGGGVSMRSLAEAIESATVAVALRVPGITHQQALEVRDFAGQQLGRPYNYWGIFRQLTFQRDRAMCRALPDGLVDACINWRGQVNMGRGRDSSFFCSELVLRAFENAGLPLTGTPAVWNTPGDIAELLPVGTLVYVGHLKAPIAGAQSLVASRRAAPAAFSRPLGDRIRFLLTASVGDGGRNDGDDVSALKERLIELGFNWLTPNRSMDSDTIGAIRLVQSIIAGRNTVSGDGRVDVPGTTYRWLQAYNAPRWQLMPAGAVGEGFTNFELLDTTDRHDYGTNWLARTLRNAAAAYRDTYLAGHAGAALMTINDVSLPHGGDTPDHAGHETGLACDLRLARTDGGTGGVTWRSADYDRDATRAQLQALRAQPEMDRIFFNDTTLIGEGLCSALSGHDNHIHFEIRPPDQGGIELIQVVDRPDSAVAGVSLTTDMDLAYGVPNARITDPFYRNRAEKTRVSGRSRGRAKHLGIDVSLSNDRGGGADDDRRGLPVHAAIKREIALSDLNAVAVFTEGGDPETGVGLSGEGNATLQNARVLVQPWRGSSDGDYGGVLGLACRYEYTKTDGSTARFTLYIEYLHLITPDFPPKDGEGNPISLTTWRVTGKGLGFGPLMTNGTTLTADQLVGGVPALVGYLGATQFPHVHIQCAFQEGERGYIRRPRIDPTVALEPFWMVITAGVTAQAASRLGQAAAVEPSEVVYDVESGREYGPVWRARQPPGLPEWARLTSRRGQAIPFIEQLARDTGLGNVFVSTVSHLAMTESGAMFARPANNFDARPPSQRPAGKSLITAWGAFQFNRDAWRALPGVPNTAFPWDADRYEEIALPVDRYAHLYGQVRAAGGDDLAAARGIRLWHRTPAGFRSYLNTGNSSGFATAWRRVAGRHRTAVDNHLRRGVPELQDALGESQAVHLALAC